MRGRPGVCIDPGVVHGKAGLAQQIADQQGCPGIEMVVDILRVDHSLRAPVVDRQTEYNLSACPQSFVEFSQDI